MKKKPITPVTLSGKARKQPKPWAIKCLPPGVERDAFQAAITMRAAIILIDSYWHPTTLTNRLGILRSTAYAQANALLKSMSDQQIAELIKSLPELVRDMEYWLGQTEHLEKHNT